MIGETISHYQILEKLGEGGMGVIYKAKDLKLDRFVALKFLPPQAGYAPEEKERFIHEAKAASALEHNHICNIHEIAETEDGQIFIVMAYYEGETLDEKIRRGPFQISVAVDTAIHICQGLARAHEAGIVHRDIKPSNIIITRRGVVKIVDFGLAKLRGRTKITKTRTTLGTVSYMSPEQARGEEVDHRTDIWSLGVVLYEMITGEKPFKSDYDQAVIYAITNENPKSMTALRADVPPELERLVRRALEKKTEKRYQHAAEMLADLKSISESMKVTAFGQQTVSLRRKTGVRTVVIGAIAGLCVAVMAISYFLFLHRPARRDRKFIAVLPFKNLSENKANEYFSDGITEDIITQLSKIEDLKVISRTSAMLYKNSEKSMRAIGRELNVGTILEGSVRRAGNQIRIVGQLIDARTDKHIWAETYDREMKDVFSIQSDVAREIAAALKASLSPEEQDRIAQEPTTNITAYDYYLKGREYYYRYLREDNENAIRLFKKALELDPAYTLALAGLGDAYAQRYGRFAFSISWLDSALSVSEKAISIDPECAEAHKAMGLIYLYMGRLRKSLQASHRAVELNPGYYPAIGNIGWVNMHLGRYEEAYKWSVKDLQLDPTGAITYQKLAFIHRYLTNDAKAEHFFRKALEFQSDFVYVYLDLSYLYLIQGRYDQALQYSRIALSMVPDMVRALISSGHAELFRGNYAEAKALYEEALKGVPEEAGLTLRFIRAETYLAFACRMTGQNEKADRIFTQTAVSIQSIIGQGNEHPEYSYLLAAIRAAAGENEDAYVWLQKAIDAGWRKYRMALVDPLLDNLRDDERFKVMMADVKAIVDEERKRVEMLERD
jgi:TolB-like protein/Tfp pilus assembly protein PilF/predicted Ser/Thr protein kinase